MRARGVLAALASLVLLLASTGSRRAAAPDCRLTHKQGLTALSQQWQTVKRLYEARRFAEALGLAEAGWRQALASGDRTLAMRFLNALGLCQFASFRYREAVQHLLEARRIAEQVGDLSSVATICANLSSTYAQMGELEAARAAAEQALTLSHRSPAPNPQLLIRVATLRARQGDWPAAEPLFRQAVEAAEQLGEGQAAALAWNTLGYHYLEKGLLEPAEKALLEAFRLRRLRGLPDLHLSYRNLALLRIAQGDLNSAAHLLEAAIVAARHSASLVPLWTLYHERGRLRLRQNRSREALDDFRHALELARRWRLEVLPAEAFQVSLDTSLQQLYGSLVEAAALEYRRTGRRALAREAFEAAEENRAASLRAMVERGDHRLASAPEDYGEALAELHAAEISLLHKETPEARTRLRQARQRLIELELQAGLEGASESSFHWNPSADLLGRLQGALLAEEAFVGFYLGETVSYRWVVTRTGFRMDRLAPGPEIARRAEGFSRAVRADSAEALARGRELYESLFGELAPEVHGKPQWLLALDAALFEAPLSALPIGWRGDRPVYLAERHALQLIAGAHLLGRRPSGARSKRFVGVGDAIYNTADSRWEGPARQPRRSGPFALLPILRAAQPSPELQLPRLPGSAREIRTCAAHWPERAVRLLEGPEASAQAVQAALAERPAVLHLAAHVIASPERPREALIALSLKPDGQPELVGPAAMRHWKGAAELVVLSGCQSGRGASLPGAGLLGLTRAFLSLGSRAVVASLWPTTDESGEFFSPFYARLVAGAPGGARAVSQALQHAQLEALASGGWRARPAYWGAYFVIGSE